MPVGYDRGSDPRIRLWLFNREHSFSELSEYEEEVCEARDAYGMELMDVIHAAETALRMKFDDSEVDQLRAAVEAKNRERGYYGEAEREVAKC